MQDLRSRAALVVAFLLAALCLAAPAALAAPSTVSVRVEGESATLVPRTVLTTTTTPVNKDGQPGHDCTGTSAAGALEQATNGDWNGPWSAFGYAVFTIKGETHDFSGPVNWSFWLNNRSASTGICGAELAQGDEVLFFPASCDFDPNTNTCSNQLVLALHDVPARIERGRPFTVRVLRYNPNGESAPVGGAAVSGGGASSTTGTDGLATIALPSTGPTTLQATAQGYVRSATEPVCSYDPAVGGCDVGASGGVSSSGPAGGPTASDTRLPVASFLGIRHGQRFSRRRAPRLLRGAVDPGAAGLHLVRFRLRRAVGGRCWFYSAVVERFRRGSCAATWFLYRVGDRPTWEYLLPARPGPGRYVLDVRVMDRWGREVTARVRFVVLG